MRLRSRKPYASVPVCDREDTGGGAHPAIGRDKPGTPTGYSAWTFAAGSLATAPTGPAAPLPGTNEWSLSGKGHTLNDMPLNGSIGPIGNGARFSVPSGHAPVSGTASASSSRWRGPGMPLSPPPWRAPGRRRARAPRCLPAYVVQPGILTFPTRGHSCTLADNLLLGSIPRSAPERETTRWMERE